MIVARNAAPRQLATGAAPRTSVPSARERTRICLCRMAEPNVSCSDGSRISRVACLDLDQRRGTVWKARRRRKVQTADRRNTRRGKKAHSGLTVCGARETPIPAAASRLGHPCALTLPALRASSSSVQGQSRRHHRLAGVLRPVFMSRRARLGSAHGHRHRSPTLLVL